MVAGLIFVGIGIIGALFLRFHAFASLTVMVAGTYAVAVGAAGGAVAALIGAATALFCLQVGYAAIVLVKVVARRARAAGAAKNRSESANDISQICSFFAHWCGGRFFH
jgi:hypothetical protein